MSVEQSPSVLRRLGFVARRLPSGLMFEPDRDHDALVFVAEGRVLVTVADASGRDRLCTLRGPGNLLGAEALASVDIPYQLWPIDEVRLLTASLSAVHGARPEDRAELLSLTAGSLGRCLEERLALSGTATSRLARFLRQTQALDGGSPPPRAVPPLPRHLLARILGMRPETLSRAIRRLEVEGIIAAEGAIEVLDPTGLRDAEDD